MAAMGVGAEVAVRERTNRNPVGYHEGLRLDLLEELGEHFDLGARLPLIPPSARLRGLYFRSIESALKEAGKLSTFEGMYPVRVSTLGWASTGEFLERLAVGAALLCGPALVGEGMWRIGHRNAVEFAESLLGRMIFRLLSRDPHKLLQQGIAGRRQTVNSGLWEITFPVPCEAVVTIREEYTPIDSYCLGAAVGTFDAIGIPVKAECVLEDRFNGRHSLRW